jgi:ubiquinone biosynthesis protein
MTVLEQLETMTRNGVRLDDETIAAIGRIRAKQTRWRTIGIWVIALTFIGILLTVR